MVGWVECKCERAYVSEIVALVWCEGITRTLCMMPVILRCRGFLNWLPTHGWGGSERE